MDPTKISAVLDWLAPKSVKDFKSFLRLANYYNRFICGFATIATPLHTVLCKGVAYTWGHT